jgi:hypothetical protein
MRRRLLILRRLEDIRNYKLIKAFSKLRRYKRHVPPVKTTTISRDDKKTSDKGAVKISSDINNDVSTGTTIVQQNNTLLDVIRAPIFGIVVMRTFLWQLFDFSKKSCHIKKTTGDKLLHMRRGTMLKVLKQLKLLVRYNKKYYVNRLQELARLYIHMLYYDFKKKINRTIAKAKRIASAKKDDLNYNIRREVKFLGKWSCFVAALQSNRLKCSGSHRYFRYHHFSTYITNNNNDS